MKSIQPKGTRDFFGKVLQQRQLLIDTLKQTFTIFGFEALETPAMESLSTLTGKYGDEGERLIFKILNNGDFLAGFSKEEFANLNTQQLANKICDKALRYDLTVPMARFVAQHYSELNFPFKRYQIQPVWRADRPQKGRFREFYQCDADVLGSTSLQYEVDLILLYDHFFHKICLPVEIHINHRKILQGIAEICNIGANFKDFAVALDKWDKIGKQKVFVELLNKGFNSNDLQQLEKFLKDNITLQELQLLLQGSSIAKAGCDELAYIFNMVNNIGLKQSTLKLNITLARGLEYYTGCIFEVKATHLAIGSLGGGGRYDNLTDIFGVKNLPGVGISFGLDRVYLAMEELNLFPQHHYQPNGVIFFNLGVDEMKAAFPIMQAWRERGIRCDFYHKPHKFAKQFEYAVRKNFHFAAIIGEDEIHHNLLTIKNLQSGQQLTLSPDDAYAYVIEQEQEQEQEQKQKQKQKQEQKNNKT